jgi:hypothetical protein
MAGFHRLRNFKNDSDSDEEEEDTVLALNYYVNINNDILKIKRGDIIKIGASEYRNDGKYIYDGKEVLNLYPNIDDYGSVPPSFEISNTEFDPYYWMGVIDHNNIFFLSKDIKETFEFKNIEGYTYTDVLIKDEKYICIVDDIENFKDDINDMFFELTPWEIYPEKYGITIKNEVYYKNDIPVFFAH